MALDRSPPHSPLATLAGRLAGYSAIYAAGAVLGLAFTMLQLAVVTRLLEVADFGRLAILLIFSGLVTVVGNLVFVQGSLASGFSGGYAGGDEFDDDGGDATAGPVGDNRRRLATGLATSLTLTALITAVSAAAAPELARALLGDSSHGTAVVWATLGGGLGSAWRLTVALPRFERRPLTYIGLQVLRHVLMIGAIVVLVEAGHGLAGAMAGLALGKAVAVAAAIVVSRHRFRIAVSREDLAAIFRRGRPFVLISVTFFFSRNVDLYLVSHFLPDRSVALYRVAGTVGLISSYALSAVLFAWGPLVRGPLRVALDRDRKLQFARGRLISYYVFLVCAVLVAIAALADVLVRIAPPSYRDAADLIALLGLAAAAQGALMVVYRMALFPGKTRFLGYVGLMSVVVLTASALLLIPPLDTTGAALAAVIAPGLGVVALLVRSQRGPEPLQLDWRELGACAALGVACILAARAATALPAGAEIVAQIAAALAFPALLLATNTFDRDEARRLVGIVRGRTLGARGRPSVPKLVAALGTGDLELIAALVRRGERPAAVAERAGEPEDAVLERLVGILRDVGGIGAPSKLDARIGRFVLSRRSSSQRDQMGYMLSLDKRIAPMEVDALSVLVQRIRRIRAGRWRQAEEAARERESAAVPETVGG